MFARDGQPVRPLRIGSTTPDRARHLRLTQRVALITLLACGACCVKDIIGPSLVVTGTSASYKIKLGAVSGFEPFANLVTEVAVLARVPDGWLLESASYAGTIGGSKTSGTPAQPASLPGHCVVTDSGATPAGFQDLLFTLSIPGGLDPADAATLTLKFAIQGPAGSFDLLAIAGGSIANLDTFCCAETLSVQVVDPVPVDPVVPALEGGARLVLVGLLLGLGIALLSRRRRTASMH